MHCLPCGSDRQARPRPGRRAPWLAVALLACLCAGRVQAQVKAGQAGPPAAGVGAADMGDMPDIGLDWPDLGADDKPLPATAEVPADAPATAQAQPPSATGPAAVAPPALGDNAVEAGAEVGAARRLAEIDPARPLRYDVQLQGLEEVADSLFRSRFDGLSELERGARDTANVAQIRRRARADVDLLDRLMRTRGYYDARIRYALDVPPGNGQRLNVDLVTEAGPLYRLQSVVLTGLASSDPREADLRALFTVKAGDPADTDRILASVEALRTALAEGGYPFAELSEPELTVDHDSRLADLDLVVRSGGFRRFGQVRLSGDPPFDARHVMRIARFAPGQPYRRSSVADLNRALITTGLAGSIDIKEQPGAEEGTVDLAIAMTRAPPRTIAGEIGYGTGEGAHIQLSWQHRNLFPPEGGLTTRGVLGTEEQSLAILFRRNNFKRRDRALNGELSYRDLHEAAYNARTVAVSASLERQTNIFFQKKWTWSLGTELLVSDERDLYGPTQAPRQRIYFIAALPTSVAYDGSDDLLDPRRGFRLSGRLSPELSLEGIAFGYARAQVDGSGYVPVSRRVTLAGRARVGTIVGASRDRIAPTRRFYAGGGGSVRGYSYQAIGPRDLNNAPIGGRSLAEFSLEARLRFGSRDQFGIVPFVDAGTISTDPLPSVREMRVGAGLGVRYYSTFGPIRIDVGTPINPQPGDPRIGVYVSLGQAF